MGIFGHRDETPHLQAYGKLPLAKDYLRVGAGEGSGRELREWLDHGFSGGVGGGEPPVFPWPLRFVWNSERAAPLLGSAWPSADAGELRRFPFALFVERRKKALVDAFADGFAESAAWFERIESFHAARANFADGQSYLAELRRGNVDPADAASAPEPDPEQIAWREWVETLWPGRGEEGVLDALGAIAELAQKSPRGPLRLPLAGGLPVGEQVAAWCRALREMRFVEKGALPSIFFPLGPVDPAVQAFLVVWNGAPTVADVRWLEPSTAPLGKSDLTDGAAHGAPASARVHGPPLTDSIVAAFVRLRARRR
jgi:hypothetical protein